MIKINVKKITLNTHKIWQIAQAANNIKTQQFLVKEANDALKEAWVKIPYNMRQNTEHMRDKYEVTKPLKASFKIEGQKFPSCQVKIKPKGKYQPYYAVVTAGVRNGKPINYSSPTATPFPLENTLKKRNYDIQLKAIEVLLEVIENVERK